MKEKLNCIIEPFIFPPLDWFLLVKNYQEIEMDITTNFIKQSYRNRYKILSSNGILDLIIPISGPKNGIPFQEIKIDQSSGWQKNHLTAIKSAYGKSPFFEYYFPEIEKIFLKHQENQSLMELCMHSIEWSLQKLKWKEIGIINFQSNGNQTTAQDFRGLIDPKPQRIQMQVPEFNYQYIQVFEDRFPFQRNLSILDLLFCGGKI